MTRFKYTVKFLNNCRPDVVAEAGGMQAVGSSSGIFFLFSFPGATEGEHDVQLVLNASLVERITVEKLPDPPAGA